MTTSETSVFAQTRSSTQSDIECESDKMSWYCKTWTWGSNKYGKLGVYGELGGPTPLLLPRSSFPNVFQAEYGNEIGGNLRNNYLSYDVWNGVSPTTNKIILSNGTKGLLRIAAEINSKVVANGHDPGVFSIFSDPASERATLQIMRPGYSFTLSQGLASVIGFDSTQFPAKGVLNEVSSRMQNNLIVYKVWVPGHKFNLLRSYFYFRAWNNSAKPASAQYVLSIPDGSYDTASLASQLNRQISAIKGLSIQPFSFGTGEFAVLTLFDAGIIVRFNLPNGVEDVLGFSISEFPSKSLYGGNGLPNEVSAVAGTNLFQYRFRNGTFNITLQTGIYGIDQVETIIKRGLIGNRHDPNAFNFVVGSDDRAVILILRAGYQALFSAGSSVGQMLGFIDMDVPCNPAYIQANLTENLVGASSPRRPFCIARYATPNSTISALCRNSTAAYLSLACGLSASSGFAKRGYFPRPFLTNYSAAGFCKFKNGSLSTALCACSGNGTLRACVALDEGTWSFEGLNSANVSYNFSTCACSKKPFLLQTIASRKWGVASQRTVAIKAGIYAYTPSISAGIPTLDLVNEMNSAITSDLLQNNISAQIALSILLQASIVNISFSIYSSEALVGIQLLFSNSTLSSFLGAGINSTVPYDHYMTQYDDPSLDANVLTYTVNTRVPYFSGGLVVLANATGEWIHHIAAGALHTIVLTKHANNARFCNGNSSFKRGCACYKTRLWSFGSNRYGQLGTSENRGTDVDNPDPILIHDSNYSGFRPECVVAVYAGGYHSAVLEMQAGYTRVWMFGRNNFGQLGLTPSIMEKATQLNYVLFGGINSLFNVSLVLGPFHTMLLYSSRVWVFGKSFRNAAAQSTNFSEVIEVSNDSSKLWTTACTGNSFAILQASDGSVWSVGDNLYGQLGISSYYTVPNVLYRIWVPDSNSSEFPITSFACGGDHSVLLTVNGTVWTFGRNLYGQLMRIDNIGLNNQNFKPSEIDSSLFSANPSDPPTPVVNVWASGDFTLVQTGRLACNPGFISTDGLEPCSACKSGEFVSNISSTVCQICGPGTHSGAGASDCDHCPFGTYSSSSGAEHCIACPSDRTGTKGSAAISIDNCSTVCSPGQYGVDGLVPCTACSPGSFSVSPASSACQQCPVGKYQPSANQSTCLTCIQNKSTAFPGSNSSKQCLAVCSAGSFGVYGLENCTLCQPGTYTSDSRHGSCTSCPADTFANQSGMSSCLNCSAGTGTNATGKTKISDCLVFCAPGNYSINGLPTCKACDPGNISKNSRSLSCIRCEAASYSCRSATECCPCPSGTYINDFVKLKGFYTCQPCPQGSYNSDNHSSSCTLCEIGKYSDVINATVCISCSTVSNSSNSTVSNSSNLTTVAKGSISAASCKHVCPGGTWSISGLPICTACANGSVSTPGSTGCTSCKSGKYSGTAAVECLSCENGTYSLNNASSCTNCRSGTFSSQLAASACTLCSYGTYTSAEGQGVCSDCDVNLISSGPGSSLCVPCAAGTFQDKPAQSFCYLCPPGTYYDGDPSTGITGCQDCNIGQYQDQRGANSCKDCLPGSFITQTRSQACWHCNAGSYQSLDGSTSCNGCAAGSFSFDDMSQCLACPVGTFSLANASSCKQCQIGYNTSKIGSISEEDCRRICRPGEFAASNGIANASGACDQCPAGKFTPYSQLTACYLCSSGAFSMPNMSTCTLCNAGTFSSDYGSTTCLTCLPGYFQSEVGYSFCEFCPAGTFSSSNFSVACSNCSTGLFTFFPASTQCSSCSPGKYAINTGCLNCPVGKYSDGLIPCIPCPAGTFNENEGSSSCESCPGGQSTARINSNASADCFAVCPPGWYGSSLGVNVSDDICQLCPKGSYNKFRQQSACRLCQAGEFSNALGLTACSLCSVGYFTDEVAQTSCIKCPHAPFPSNQETRTIADGASDVSLCRIFDADACVSSPRRYGIYPLYTVGKNDYGQNVGDSFFSIGSDSNMRSINPYLIRCDLLGFGEIFQFQTSGNHSFFLSVKSSYDNRMEFSLWSVGKNTFGQLGSEQNVGTQKPNSQPLLVPRALFPNTTCGNSISGRCGNNLFYYWRWNDEKNIYESFTLTIDDGLYGPSDLGNLITSKAREMHNHSDVFFRIDFNNQTQRAIVLICKSGYQVDFTRHGTIRTNIGFPPVKIPSTSTLNEISSRTGNTFTYRIWCQDFQGTGCNTFRTVKLVFSDGIYDIDRVNQELQQVSLTDGTDPLFTTEDGLDLSWQLIKFEMLSDRVLMTISGLGVQVMFGDPSSIANFLGFQSINYPSFGPTNSSDVQFQAQESRGYLSQGSFTPYEQEGDTYGQIPTMFSLGSDFTLIQTLDYATNKSRLWGVGSNQYGQLGVPDGAGSDMQIWVPVLVPLFDEFNAGLKAVTFKTGAEHSFVVDQKGNLWVFGSNEFGQLGRKDNQGTRSPNPEPLRVAFPETPVNEISAQKGNNYILIIVSNASYKLKISDGVYTEDDLQDIENQLGAGLCSAGLDCSRLHLSIGVLDDSKIVFQLTVSTQGIYQLNFMNNATANLFGFNEITLNPPCSMNASACLYKAESDSALFFRGRNQISRFSVGYFHSLVETENSYTGKRMLWAWGSNKYGQLGSTAKLCQYDNGLYKPCVDGSSYSAVPILLPESLFSNHQLKLFNAGGYHSIVQDVSDTIWCFGWNRYGQCGYPLLLIPILEMANPIPTRVQLNISQLKFRGGHSHSLYKTKDSKILSVGSNAYGELIRSTSNLGNENADFDAGPISYVGNEDPSQTIIDYATGSFQSLLQTYRPYCEEGHFSVDGRSPCQICDAGSYSAAPGTRNTSDFSLDQSVVHPYFPGTEFQFTAANVTLSCAACPPGAFSLIGSSNCSSCGVGTYSLGGASLCHSCPAGSYASEPLSSACKQCEAGKSSTSGQSQCLSCAPGTFANTSGSSSCFLCDAGTFADKNDTELCQLCDAGTYQNRTAQTSCIQCPSGLTTGQKGTKLSDDCLALCLAGQEGKSVHPNGPAVKNCKDCAKGSYSFNPNSVNGFGATTCIRCEAGTFSSSAGTSQCSECYSGTFNSMINATSCKFCPAGTYALKTSSTFCDNCQSGFASSGNSSGCSICPAGSFSISKSANCSDCGRGRYSPIDGSATCVFCGAGSFNGLTRSSFCTECNGGSFSSGYGMSTCIACKPGSVSSSNATSCKACLPGTYAQFSGMSLCPLCDVGKYQTKFNSTGCTECPAGKSTLGPGNKFDSRCTLGQRLCDIPEWHTSLDSCSSYCTPGHFSFWGIEPCLKCPVGFYNTNNASTICLACMPGSSVT